MLSTDITDTPAYSGKPVVTLIGMDTTGHFVGIKVLKHSEPILLLGIPESALTNFNHQYLGKSVSDKIEIGQSRPEEGVLGVDAISGATVTVIAQNQVLMVSASAVARQTGILAPEQRIAARYITNGHRWSWQELVCAAAQPGRCLPDSECVFAARPWHFVWIEQHCSACPVSNLAAAGCHAELDSVAAFTCPLEI